MTYIPSQASVLLSPNSSSSPLLGGASFNGTSQNVEQYSSITIIMLADVKSAENGVVVEFSADSINWVMVYQSAYNANSSFSVNVPKGGEYFKVTVTNGESAQTVFNLQSFAEPNFVETKSRLSTAAVGAQLPSDASHSFGRLRVSNSYLLLDLKHVHSGNNRYESSLTTGSGTVTYVSSTASQNLAVVGTGRALRQSRSVGIYQQGNLLTLLATGVINDGTNQVNSMSRIGYYDDNNGCYFQFNGSDYGVGLRSDVTGSVVNSVVNQSSWNIDKMDGKGMSGITVDFTKTQIFYLDVQWLCGSVRFGLIINSSVHFVHGIMNANIQNNVRMRSPFLNVRFEMSSTGGNGALKWISASLHSDNRVERNGTLFSIVRSSVIGIGTTLAPVLAIKINTTVIKNQSVNAILNTVGVLSTNGANFAYEIWYFQDVAVPTTILPGASFVAVNAAGSVIQYDQSATSIVTTNGNRIISGVASNDSDAGSVSIDYNFARLTTNASGVSDILVVCVFTFGGNETFTGTMNWSEIGS